LLSARKILGEDDFELVQNFGSADQLLGEIQRMQQQQGRSAVTQLLANLKTPLLHLQTFAIFIAPAACPSSISLACVWGVVYLLIQVSRRRSAKNH
jgi:hypothetical protein